MVGVASARASVAIRRNIAFKKSKISKATAFVTLFLISCSAKVPIYPDYCQINKRKFSDSDKIDATLAFIYYNIKEKKLRYYRSSQFFKFIGDGNDINREISIYRKHFPKCCRVIRPPAYAAWYSGMRRDGFSQEEIMGKPGDWVADVSVKKDQSDDNGIRKPWADFKVSNCNKVDLISRG